MLTEKDRYEIDRTVLTAYEGVRVSSLVNIIKKRNLRQESYYQLVHMVWEYVLNNRNHNIFNDAVGEMPRDEYLVVQNFAI